MRRLERCVLAFGEPPCMEDSPCLFCSMLGVKDSVVAIVLGVLSGGRGVPAQGALAARCQDRRGKSWGGERVLEFQNPCYKEWTATDVGSGPRKKRTQPPNSSTRLRGDRRDGNYKGVMARLLSFFLSSPHSLPHLRTCQPQVPSPSNRSLALPPPTASRDSWDMLSNRKASPCDSARRQGKLTRSVPPRVSLPQGPS